MSFFNWKKEGSNTRKDLPGVICCSLCFVGLNFTSGQVAAVDDPAGQDVVQIWCKSGRNVVRVAVDIGDPYLQDVLTRRILAELLQPDDFCDFFLAHCSAQERLLARS